MEFRKGRCHAHDGMQFGSDNELRVTSSILCLVEQLLEDFWKDTRFRQQLCLEIDASEDTAGHWYRGKTLFAARWELGRAIHAYFGERALDELGYDKSKAWNIEPFLPKEGACTEGSCES